MTRNGPVRLGLFVQGAQWRPVPASAPQKDTPTPVKFAAAWCRCKSFATCKVQAL